MSRAVKLLVSIDTEEDNWEPSRADLTVENIRALPRFGALMQRLGLAPTYFVSYQVANTLWAAATVQELAEISGGEIASHLHPWNTPPIEEELIGANTMTKNLTATLQRRKLVTLTCRHTEIFSAPPISFRTGRFGFGPSLVAPLLDLGYKVDSSVTPYWSWEDMDDGPSYVEATPEVYQLGADCSRVDIPDEDGALLEVPVSCGFNRRPFELWNRVHGLLRTPAGRRLHAPGIAWRTGMVRRLFLSPELHGADDLLTLGRRIVDRGVGVLHLMLHSPTLRPGLSPFTATDYDVDHLLGAIEEFVTGMARFAEITPATVGSLALDEDRYC